MRGSTTALAGAAIWLSAQRAAALEVTVGYQLIYAPWAMAIVRGTFEKETGASLRWVKFDSGAKAIQALASGEVDIAVAGSSAIAVATSRGVDIQLFMLEADIASAEALVVRNRSGIDRREPLTLVGKRIGVPFVSTAHFHMLVALGMWGLRPDQVTLLNMQPNQIATAWERGAIDAGFVWDPTLGRLKANGTVMITSGEIAQRTGHATFDGVVVRRSFAEAHPEFVAAFVDIVDRANEDYRRHPAAWTPDSEPVQAVVNLVGGDPADVPATLALYRFPTLEELASPQWFGGGKEARALHLLAATARFLEEQGKLEDIKPDYSPFVTSRYVEMVLARRKG
ncbi:Taurine-binding periplasmic protein [bacterium HR40]|nr:Taurine-binding periplasmic protein [bacterium HR40]